MCQNTPIIKYAIQNKGKNITYLTTSVLTITYLTTSVLKLFFNIWIKQLLKWKY